MVIVGLPNTDMNKNRVSAAQHFGDLFDAWMIPTLSYLLSFPITVTLKYQSRDFHPVVEEMTMDPTPLDIWLLLEREEREEEQEEEGAATQRPSLLASRPLHISIASEHS